MEQLERRYDFDNLQDYKDYLYTVIDGISSNTIFNGFTFDTKPFSLSISAQINWSNLLQLPDSIYPITISCKDETTYSLTLANKVNFYLTCVSTKNDALQAGTVKKQQVFNATTIADLVTIQNSL